MVLVLDWAFSSWLSQLLLDHLLSPSSKIVLLSLLLCSLSLSVCVSIWGGGRTKWTYSVLHLYGKVSLDMSFKFLWGVCLHFSSWGIWSWNRFLYKLWISIFTNFTSFPTYGGGWGMVESSLGWKLGDLDSISRFATNCLILDILSRHYFLIYTTRRLK